MDGAFQYGAFQFDAFQIVSPAYVKPAFQPCGFQADAFQSAPCPNPPAPVDLTPLIYGGGGTGFLKDQRSTKTFRDSGFKRQSFTPMERGVIEFIVRFTTDYL